MLKGKERKGIGFIKKKKEEELLREKKKREKLDNVWNLYIYKKQVF